jgi:divalent metal cation (Fe/Co/Zn/Cd) transporter
MGDKHHVEVDLVLPATMPMRQAHDVGERLEVLLESLTDIERAHVHLDWETDHKAEHQGTKGTRVHSFAPSLQARWMGGRHWWFVV